MTLRLTNATDGAVCRPRRTAAPEHSHVLIAGWRSRKKRRKLFSKKKKKQHYLVHSKRDIRYAPKLPRVNITPEGLDTVSGRTCVVREKTKYPKNVLTRIHKHTHFFTFFEIILYVCVCTEKIDVESTASV